MCILFIPGLYLMLCIMVFLFVTPALALLHRSRTNRNK